MAPYTTRLIVLGVVRIFGPAHGYLLLQELNSWQVDRWANVKPGSIYSSLRTLQKEDLVEILPQDHAELEPKAIYQITDLGLAEFDRLLRQAIFDVTSPTVATVMAAISFLPFLPRGEALELLGQRQRLLEDQLNKLREQQEHFAEHTELAPPHVAEHFYFGAEVLASHQRWIESAIERIQKGAYSFAGDPPLWSPPADNPVWGDSQG
ncbi:PadR family transcriptional regulator [Acaricomes phytoseiuli]|uniref:PadR family transcriptional regulator n=1 Tax=Acaricomes phytoseiuli TaxID=291968 RepID=UPI0022226A89|nr:PadR family transcriptional regulator [Acaricomes phytoseiuli]MCW1249821.1 PadR family transcriptional regulator [Acaricomes phytoseiuli]